MLGSVSWDQLFMVLVAALVVLRPERLPDAVRWATRTLRQVRDAVTAAALFAYPPPPPSDPGAAPAPAHSANPPFDPHAT
jgi:hypothetical protein